jgi:hypothetical protein
MGEVRYIYTYIYIHIYIYLVEKPQWSGMLGTLLGKWKLKVNKI